MQSPIFIRVIREICGRNKHITIYNPIGSLSPG